MKATLPLAALGAALMLSACTDDGGALDAARFNQPDFGASVNSNIAAESVPADPVAVNSPVEADGARQSLAQQRYRNDRVKTPPDLSTSSLPGSMNGNSGNGAGGSGAAASGTPGSY